MNPLSNVTSWLYHLGEADAARRQQIGQSEAGLVVVDYADGAQVPYTPAQIDAMRGANDKLVVSYLSVGEAEQYREYWKASWATNPPAFIAEPNPEWTDNFKVAYWDPAWKAIVFDYVDDIVAGGFNGVYLDIIDAYAYWEERNPGRGDWYKREMIKFVAEIRAHAQARLAELGDSRDFVVIGQNGEDLADFPAYLQAVDGIGKEDLYFYYPNGQPGTFGPVPDGWLTGSKELLEKAEAARVEVFVVEYVPPGKAGGVAADFAAELAYLRDLGVPLYVAPERDLTGIYDSYPIDGTSGGGTGGGTGQDLEGTAGADILSGRADDDRIDGRGGADELYGRGGDDLLLGGAGADVLLGGTGHDRLAGGGGTDLLQGGDGADRLSGGSGDDDLVGGGGRDAFVFRGSWGWDVIRDFRPGTDELSVTTDRDHTMRETRTGTVIEFDGGSAIVLRGVFADSWDDLL